MSNRSLGKGLSALIPERIINIEDTQEESLKVKTMLINNHSMQPRVDYDDTRMEELVASIRENGILQPILVRKKGEGYEVIAGERRLRAARKLNLREVPAIIKEVSDQDALVFALIENIQREDLNPIEEAEAYKKLIEEFGYTQEEAAESVGKQRSTITNLLRLLKLSSVIKNSVARGALSVGHARALLGVEDLIDRDRLYKFILEKGITVREVERIISARLNPDSKIKVKPIRDHEVIALEERLRMKLGTKVSVVSKKKKGKIVIDYYSLDDLDRILKIIN